MSQTEHLIDRPAGDEPVEVKLGPATRAPASWWRAVRPAHIAVVILLGGALCLLVSPINDIDSYWHVEIGREVLQRHTVDGLGRQWLGAPAPSWRTSQWLSEVGMYLAVEHIGWIALPVLRLLAGSALFAVLVVTLLRRRQPVLAFVVLLLVVAGVEGLLQDRPATLSLVFIALLAAACERLWTAGRRPPVALVAGSSLLWAQLHGLWVLAPAAFLLVALGAVLDRRSLPHDHEQARGALICAAASLAGTVNPRGPVSFLLPLQFRHAGANWIAEWAPTSFTIAMTWCWGILLCLVVLGWVRSSRRIPWTELLWVFAWSVFAVLALRNVGPAILLIAPVAVRALESSAGVRLAAAVKPTSSREAVFLGGFLVVVVAGMAAVGVRNLATLDPLRDTPALAMARRLAAVDRPLRVWDAYNVSGTLVAFGRGRDGHLELVVDGRSDLWGATYLDQVFTAEHMAPDWSKTFGSFHPDAVLLESGLPLVQVLQSDRHWHVVMTDDEYVLLMPPGRTL